MQPGEILVLDEATSSLDGKTEKAVMDSIEIISENTTIIMIAHRLSTIRRADRIIVLDNSKIIEDGTHDELVSKADGFYSSLWNIQTGKIDI